MNKNYWLALAASFVFMAFMTFYIMSGEAWSVELQEHKTNYIGTGKGEVKFHLSMKTPIYDNLYFAYSQKSFWAVREISAPFREHNFNPEVFIDDGPIRIGHEHESTGVAGEDSRSWERSYLQTFLRFPNVEISAKGWHSWPVYQHENPDIADYQGNGELQIQLNVYDKIIVQSVYRIKSNVIQLFYDIGDSYIFFQVFKGYGEGLVNYDKYSERVLTGIALNY